ncbi:MAG: SRPBCC family protein [Flavobacteriaceae bacterium]|nr:SRPBCC family protein [Flavobacteriaceae bacterium]
MKLYKLETKQHINATLADCWDFFSSPKNLKVITPDYMGFEIIDGLEDTMYPGQIIQYYVKPVMGIPLKWVTEITQVRDKEYFIDEQRFGPYKIWHHKHFFNEVADGVEMRDVVHYGLPLGFLGRIAHRLFIKKQLKTIFEYRFQKVNKLFNGSV